MILSMKKYLNDEVLRETKKTDDRQETDQED